MTEMKISVGTIPNHVPTYQILAMQDFVGLIFTASQQPKDLRKYLVFSEFSDFDKPLTETAKLSLSP